MNLNKFNQFLAKEAPVQAKIPCRGCVFLHPVVDENNNVSEYYMKCTYQQQIVNGAYWQHPKEYTDPATWRNIKYMDGPFTNDVTIVECKVRKQND